MTGFLQPNYTPSIQIKKDNTIFMFDILDITISTQCDLVEYAEEKNGLYKRMEINNKSVYLEITTRHIPDINIFFAKLVQCSLDLSSDYTLDMDGYISEFNHQPTGYNHYITTNFEIQSSGPVTTLIKEKNQNINTMSIFEIMEHVNKRLINNQIQIGEY